MPDDLTCGQISTDYPVIDITINIGAGLRVEHISDSVLQFGYTPLDLTSDSVSLSRLLHPDDRSAFGNAIRKSISSPLLGTEYRIVTRSGDIQRVSLYSAPVRQCESSQSSIRLIMVNVIRGTSTKGATQENHLLQEIPLIALTDGIWTLEPSCGTVILSSRLLETLGYPSADTHPTEYRWDHLIHPEDLSGVNRAVQDFLHGSNARFQVEFRMRTGSGAWKRVRSRGTVEKADRNNQLPRIFGIVTDIHEQETIPAQLPAFDSVHRDLFLHMHSGMALFCPVKDDEGNTVDWEILDVNPAFERIYEHPANSAAGKRLSEVCTALQCNPDDFLPPLSSELQVGERKIFDRHIERLDKWIQGHVFIPAAEYVATIVQNATGQKVMESRLFDSEQRYRTMFDEAMDAILVLAIGGEILDANKTATRLLGYTLEELQRLSIPDLKTENERHTIRTNTEAILRDGQIFFESALVTKSGDHIPVEINSTLIPYGDGRAALCIARDIRERKRQEQELKESQTVLEERVKERTTELLHLNQNLKKEIAERRRTERELLLSETLLPQLPDAVIVTDLRGTVVRWTGNAEQIFGYSAEDIIGKSVSILHHPSVIGHMLDNLHRALDEHGSFYGEIPCLKKTGEEVLVETTVRPVLDKTGSHILNIGNNRDITARKKMEKKLQASESRYRELVQSMRDFVIRVNRQGIFTFVNDSFCIQFQKPRQDLIGQKTAPFLPHVTVMRAQTDKQDVSQSLFVPFLIEQRLETADGERWIAWENYPVRNADSEITEFQCVGHDITKLKRSEEELILYQKRLQTLASKMSLIEERHRRRMAEILHDGIGQSLALCKYLIAALPGTRGKKGFMSKIIEIQDTIDGVIRQTRSLTFELSPPMLYELGLSKAIKRLADQMLTMHGISFHLTSNIETDPLNSDLRGLLFQSVRELFVNIIKHSKANNVIIDILNDEQGCRIAVEDDGVGFDPAHLSEHGPKSCYGLFSITERVHFADGNMSIDSVPGKGTKVILFVPIYTESTQEG